MNLAITIVVDVDPDVTLGALKEIRRDVAKAAHKTYGDKGIRVVSTSVEAVDGPSIAKARPR